MSYTREPTFIDFHNWIHSNETLYKDFYSEHILPLILELEPHDYFGTEGFDKRFG